MVVREAGTIFIIVFVVALVGLGISSRWLMDGSDNVIEEKAEQLIEQELGLPEGFVDLSPDTPEESHG